MGKCTIRHSFLFFHFFFIEYIITILHFTNKYKINLLTYMMHIYKLIYKIKLTFFYRYGGLYLFFLLLGLFQNIKSDYLGIFSELGEGTLCTAFVTC